MLFIFLTGLGNLVFSVLNLPLPLVAPVSLFTFSSLCLVAKCLKSLPCAQNQSCFAWHPVFRREALSHSLAAGQVCVGESRVAQVHPISAAGRGGPRSAAEQAALALLCALLLCWVPAARHGVPVLPADSPGTEINRLQPS